MFVLIWLAGPFLLAALLTYLAGAGWARAYLMFGLGVVLAFGFLLFAYLRASPDYQHSNGTDGEMFLGRWWDPTFVFFLLGVGYVLWMLGVAVGLFARAVVGPGQRSEPDNGS